MRPPVQRRSNAPNRWPSWWPEPVREPERPASPAQLLALIRDEKQG